MTATRAPTTPGSPEQHSHRAWMTSSAIDGTIGTALGAVIAFFLSIVLRAPTDVLGLTQQEILAALFQHALLASLRDGLCLGLALGISFALAWLPWIEDTARYPDQWITTTIISTVIGITLAYLGVSLGEWYYRRSMVVTALGGAGAGLIVGGAQSYVLWSRGRGRLRWLATQSLAFAGVFVLMAYANRGISGLFLFPLVWLAMWGIYGLGMGYTFQEIAYNHPNESREPLVRHEEAGAG
jgi:hypothetical protein